MASLVLYIVFTFVNFCFLCSSFILTSRGKISLTNPFHRNAVVNMNTQGYHNDRLDHIPLSRHDERITSSNHLELVEIRERLRVDFNVSYVLSDATITRFVGAYKKSMNDGLHSIFNHINWRLENNVDVLRSDTSSFVSEFNQKKCLNEGFDRMNRPIVTMIAQRHMKNNRNIDEVCKYIVHVLETALEQSKTKGAGDEKVTILFDMTGFSTTNLDHEAIKLLIDILLKNYPNILSQSLIVNSPFLFRASWALIKPWLDPVTAAKCVFLKPHELDLYIDYNQLPIDVVKNIGLQNQNTISRDSTINTPTGDVILL